MNFAQKSPIGSKIKEVAKCTKFEIIYQTMQNLILKKIRMDLLDL